MRSSAIIYMDSPMGQIKIAGDADAIKLVQFVKGEERPTEGILPLVVRNCKKQLNEYFHGKRKEFNVPLAPEGTAFQKEVWASLLKIPFGETSTYLQQSVKLGGIKKIRAVGTANGKNPIIILIPCHRVIASDGSLTGYAGGLDKKEWLLRHEKSLPGQNQTNLF